MKKERGGGLIHLSALLDLRQRRLGEKGEGRLWGTTPFHRVTVTHSVSNFSETEKYIAIIILL